jgi:23S rRNA pseudouridine2605 synthase
MKTEKPGRPERVIKFDRSKLPERTAKPKKVIRRGEKNENPDLMRLNKYIANSGVCSRREADKLIVAGAVSVNGKIVTELGTKVGPGDKVQYGEQTINREKPRYVLLNKPKGYITTVDDPEKRKTVMNLVAGACRERIYPVGRLDRNTTGLLLFTNDGIIAKKLTHPRYGIKKIYHVEIDKNLARADFLKIAEGFKLDDELIKVDTIEYIGDGKDKKQIGIELHSGQNRIVRRIFEHFEYKVLRLDRVYYAGLTKKNLPRGTWRFLDEQEINLLKMISSKP